jgi:hypothetical protein
MWKRDHTRLIAEETARCRIDGIVHEKASGKMILTRLLDASQKSQIQKPNFKGSGIDNQNDKAKIPAMFPLLQPKARLA